jgi:hypothetical protein
MPKPFAIIPDSDLAGASPVVRLVYQDDQVPPLRAQTDWNPVDGFPTIARTDFAIVQLEPHPLTNDVDGTSTAMHICGVQPSHG